MTSTRERPGGAAPAPRPARSPAARSPLRAVALPAEHGGWSLTLEPVLLGLLVEWSWAGLLLGLAAFTAFLARTPTKVVLVDRWRHRWSDRTRLAATVAVAEIAVLVVLVVLALQLAARPFWLPLAVAAPLVATELWFDMRSRSRRLAPELAGAIGMGSVAAAVALAGGAPSELAYGLWCLLAARSLAAIPFVRLQLRRGHGHAVSAWHSDASQALSLVVVLAGWLSGAVPGAAVLALAGLALFDVVQVRRPPPRAVVVGVQQTVLGLLLVAITALAVGAG